MRKKSLPMLLFGVLYAAILYGQTGPDFISFINRPHAWVDSVFQKLTPKERIAQLFLVRAHSNLGQSYIDSVEEIIRKEQLGGLVVFQGGPVRHAEMLNRYQKVAKVPLLVACDGEWGLGMRLPDSTISYPYQMTLGAVQNEKLIYEMGRQIARDFQRIGMHFNFAPVVDVNNNAKNPVINYRSFGDNKYNVTRKAQAYMEGLVDGGILASLKHFPGHGDTDVDSHYDLPQLFFSKRRLDSLEIFPFKELINRGAPAVMAGHINIPMLDTIPNIPASISRNVVMGVLRKELGFKGLSVTDAMDMEGVKKFFPNGEADVMAIEAGHDLIELSENSARGIGLVERGLRSGRIKQEELDERVKRVLAAKYWLGLDRYRSVNTVNLVQDLNTTSAESLVQGLADAAVTVLKSDKRIRTFDRKQKTAIVSIGADEFQDFERGLLVQLPDKKEYLITGKETAEEMNDLLKEVRRSRQIILAIHDNHARPQSALTFSVETVEFISRLAGKRTITVLFANPYVMDELPIERSSSIIMGYQNDSFMQKAALKVLFGVKTKGKLPVTVNKRFVYGDGL